MPNWIWSDAVLTDVGRALRQWHAQAEVSEASPFPWAVQKSRLTSLLAAYGALGQSGPYEGGRVMMVTAERLEAIASWTEEHVRRNGVVALERHPALYRKHAQWLRSLREAG